jgi:hypothetical protein
MKLADAEKQVRAEKPQGNFMLIEIADHYGRLVVPHADGVAILAALAKILEGMLAYEPFPLVTVHDEFKAHANNLNHVRSQYREILAEIAESNVLDDILSQIHGCPGTFNKLSFNLPDQIRQSNYALS